MMDQSCICWSVSLGSDHFQENGMMQIAREVENDRIISEMVKRPTDLD